MRLALIISPSWGKAGELALALGWRPQGRHFQTPQGDEGRLLAPQDDFLFICTRGSTLHLIAPVASHVAKCAQYLVDMRRADSITIYPEWTYG